jgi:hypothetical protein
LTFVVDTVKTGDMGLDAVEIVMSVEEYPSGPARLTSRME